jgi:WD40 repeat protein
MNAISPRLRRYGLVILALSVYSCGRNTALATSISRSPKTAILLNDSKRFIAQDAWNSTALYRVGDGTMIHRFVAPDWIEGIAISPDETFLLLASFGGKISLWKTDTGEQVWASQSGLESVHSPSFARNGESCIVCGTRDEARIFQSRTGQRIGVVRFPTMQNDITSAALSPDGSSGVLIELGERVYTFDVATGQLADTGMTGAFPVRYSVDGKFIAFRSSNSGISEQLIVVAMDGKCARHDVGQFSQICHITPAEDGTFLLTGMDDKTDNVVGVQVWPATGKRKELWRYPPKNGISKKTDCLPQSMIGVSTDYRLVTTLIDLQTGTTLRSIDNSANREPPLVTRIWNDLVEQVGWVGLVCGAIIAIGLLAFLLRRRRVS